MLGEDRAGEKKSEMMIRVIKGHLGYSFDFITPWQDWISYLLLALLVQIHRMKANLEKSRGGALLNFSSRKGLYYSGDVLIEEGTLTEGVRYNYTFHHARCLSYNLMEKQ